MSHPILIAGPCAAESEQQLNRTATQLHDVMQARGRCLDFFRAGVWKPRSHPDSFTGLGEQALPWLAEIHRQFGFDICVEVMTAKQVELCEKHGITAFWVGARTCVNPLDVQKIADAVQGKPFTVMVKNPLVADFKLWAGNVERFLNADIAAVMAIHRGFSDRNENVYRNAPCWEIPVELKIRYPELPILCDPSHLCGDVRYIPQMAQLSQVYGFNGLMVECHCDPEHALSDAEQQMTPAQWGEMLDGIQFTANAPNLDLVRQRAILENIDTQLSVLLEQRMQVVDDISKIKQENHLPVVQPLQWQKVVERYRKAGQDEAYQAFIQRFLDLLHQASISRQQHD